MLLYTQIYTYIGAFWLAFGLVLHQLALLLVLRLALLSSIELVYGRLHLFLLA